MTITAKTGLSRAERKRLARIRNIERRQKELLNRMTQGESYSTLGKEFEQNKEDLKLLKAS